MGLSKPLYLQGWGYQNPLFLHESEVNNWPPTLRTRDHATLSGLCERHDHDKSWLGMLYVRAGAFEFFLRDEGWGVRASEAYIFKKHVPCIY